MSGEKWKYKNNDGVEEDVELEEWHWEAEYNDGTVLKQFDDDGEFHRVSEIDFTQVYEMRLVSEQGETAIKISWKPEYKLIFFYRNATYHAGRLDQEMARLYCFGYEDGKGKQTIHVAKPKKFGKAVEVVDGTEKAKL